jgi:CBS domain-containing protein
MRVSELMSSSVVSITADDTAASAARLMSYHNIGALPVCGADNKLRGIVTDRDIVLRCVASETDPEATKVREIMTRDIECINADADMREAARIMSSEQIRRLPVVRDGAVVGMLSLGDLARTQSFDMEASRALSEISMPTHKYGKGS